MPEPQSGALNHFAIFAMAGVVGIEPTSTVLETGVLPLYYTPIVTIILYQNEANIASGLIKGFLAVSVNKGFFLLFLG